METEQSFTQSVRDPFININREDKENPNIYKYGKLLDEDIVFKDDNDGNNNQDDKDKNDLKKTAIQLIYHITDENWFDMDSVKTKSGESFGRKHEVVSGLFNKTEANFDIVYWMSDFMIKILMQNSFNSQIYLIDWQSKISQDQFCEEEASIVTLLLFDKHSSNFMPVLYGVSNGPLMYETVESTLNFMKDEFPNIFKPVKYIVDNNKELLGCYEGVQIHYNFYNHIRIIWQQMLDSFIWTLDDLINEDILLFVLFIKAVILWSEDKDLNTVSDMFESSSINQANLRRFLHNFSLHFSQNYQTLDQVNFLDWKWFELFKEVEIAKELINTLFYNLLPRTETHRFSEWMEAVQSLESEYQRIYDSATNPNEDMDRFSPICDVALSMNQIKNTIMKWINEQLSMKEIKENLRFGTMLEENATVVLYSELFESVEILRTFNLIPPKLPINKLIEHNDIDDIVDIEIEENEVENESEISTYIRLYTPQISLERNEAFFTVFN